MEIREWLSSHTLLHTLSILEFTYTLIQKVGSHVGQTVTVAIEIEDYKSKAIKSVFYNKAQSNSLLVGSHPEQFQTYRNSKRGQ